MNRTLVALAAACSLTLAAHAQMPAGGAPNGGAPNGPPPGFVPPPEKARPIENGGIFVPGWKATVDVGAVKQGQTEKDSSLKMEGKAMHVMTGPALTYYDPKNIATGSYTVSATFNEPKYMNRNTHPHPYGIMVAGSKMGTPDESSLYCAAYGNGSFIVRGFGPAAFQLNGRMGEKNDAVHKAAAADEPVTQKIAVKVTADTVSCIINDATVATYPKADIVTTGKLASTDGVYGIRFAHNTDAIVSDLKVTKP